ncbi:MAG: paraquat-inducible protein A [Gammaproteobacteria bacterium]|nr:paraquat-inducible protein A [Gammaproteobacteria bacterium]
MLIACPSCDLLQDLPRLSARQRATCARCGQLLARHMPSGLSRCAALTATAIVLLLLANMTPLMSLSVLGRNSSTTILNGAVQMWHQGQPIAAAIIAFCAIIAPGAFLTAMAAVLNAARRPTVPAWTSEILRWTRYLHAWSLIEVMLLGLLVSLVKIAQLARVGADIGIFAVGALTVLFPLIVANFDAAEIWSRIEWVAQADTAARRGSDARS